MNAISLREQRPVPACYELFSHGTVCPLIISKPYCTSYPHLEQYNPSTFNPQVMICIPICSRVSHSTRRISSLHHRNRRVATFPEQQAPSPTYNLCLLAHWPRSEFCSLEAQMAPYKSWALGIRCVSPHSPRPPFNSFATGFLRCGLGDLDWWIARARAGD
jgi:hypothetical protein